MKTNLKIALILSAAVLAACGGDEQQPEQPAASNSAVESAPRTAPRSTADQRGDAAAVNQADQEELIAAPRLKGESPVAGDGLNLLVFASDRAEYQESLRLIAEQTSDEQYQQLDAALRYLMINDPSIMNDEQRLFEAINGKTGMEILQMTADLLDNRPM